ncbi:ATP-binding cassette subfamily B protein [Chitinophaga terrae (ex Kim and Jung 2007)]|uniref:peptidase domain-containing ABC transporter n=1 Tax=Chitinophaga terrae (ex Kim and Jung 2007) TaxID=408074 RepID=UPI00277D85DF|nr:peptidase domain-containing ABC transporter [Chitinophaga terrae (ex Kim and Jung 2007)]MDQ0109044.1 ATP-binding cassette subfamily B protein [Chitinophaga terrae (ex Kim and Jung 2007)]
MSFLKNDFTYYKQLNAMDCGPTCLRMVAKAYGKHYNTDTLRQMTGFSKAGVSLLGISDTAEKLGFRSRGVKLSYEKLMKAPLPAILHWKQNHFVVLTKSSKKGVKIADPAIGIINYPYTDFLKYWTSSKDENGTSIGVALLLEPTPIFYQHESEKENKLSWSLVSKYLISARWQLFQVLIAFVITSLLTLTIPFLTQSVVDIGINSQNMQFITIVLIAEAVLAFSQTFISFIRSRILLRISNILNIQILSDFWRKLTKLPVSYFDLHHTGDTLQRLGDHGKIQAFLLGTALSTVFSFFNFFIYAVVLIIYNVNLFLIFCAGSTIYFIWVQLFLRIRRRMNYESFHLSAKENNVTLQFIQGMQEIRLNNAEKQKRWEWENIKANTFKLGFKNLNYSQIQSAGAVFINNMQGLSISFIVSKLVVDGKLTFGAMIAVQYIIGQLSGPIEQWVGFVQSLQDAKISMERLNEIHQLDDEEDVNKRYITRLPDDKGISIKNLSFTYPSAGNEPVLQNINLVFPENKVTAIVGASGSGKTTLIKILLKIYEQYEGEIRIGLSDKQSEEGTGIKFNAISHSYWRGECGAVLQDGFIFNDTIARNIAVGVEDINYNQLIYSCKIANIHSFIESLPNGYYTKLGADGTGVSQGQRQRILIARAIYKNPAYLFFDEATNSLDANNEKEIIENLENLFKGKTVVIVAHRLSTVRNADKIIVLDKGKIIEEGTHEELSGLKGKYYELVKNQLELGK